MPKLSKSINKVGNFLIREFWRDRNWCRIDAVVDVTSADGVQFEPGEIVGRATVGTGPFGEVTVANHATLLEFGIIVDERIGDPTFFDFYHADVIGTPDANSAQRAPAWTGGAGVDTDYTLALLVGGPSMVRQDGMEYGELTTQAEKDVVNAVLEAQGIRINKQLTGKHYEVTPFEPYV